MISTALRTGTPLPQITPCPLLDRFVAHHHGLHILHDESVDQYGLPRNLTIETLENEQYLYELGTKFAGVFDLHEFPFAATLVSVLRRRSESSRGSTDSCLRRKSLWESNIIFMACRSTSNPSDDDVGTIELKACYT